VRAGLVRVLDEIVDALARAFLQVELLRDAPLGELAGARGQDDFDVVIMAAILLLPGG